MNIGLPPLSIPPDPPLGSVQNDVIVPECQGLPGASGLDARLWAVSRQERMP